MSYMVLYTGLDGRGSFGRCDELPEAVAEVERLRNEQSIEDAQIFRLEEVKFEIKPYFRVEIPGIASATPTPMSTVAPSAAADDFPAPWSAAAGAGSAAAGAGSAAAGAESAGAATASADVPSMVIPPPPPPPPAPVAPMGFDGGTFATDDEAIVGSRRGLFGR